MVVHACSPSTKETEPGRSQIQGQLGLHSKTLSQKTKTSLFLINPNLSRILYISRIWVLKVMNKSKKGIWRRNEFEICSSKLAYTNTQLTAIF
jgi:hypothetical protein